MLLCIWKFIVLIIEVLSEYNREKVDYVVL